MKIKTKLQIIGILPVAIAIIIGLIIFSTGKQIKDAMEKDRIAGEIIISVFQKTSLRDEYLLNHEERAKAQWYSTHESIRELLILASEKFKDSEERAILDEISTAHKKTWDLFSQLVANYGKQKPGEAENAATQEIRERILGQLLIDSQTMVSDTLRLDRAAHAKLFAVRRRSDLLIAFSVVILAIAIGGASFLIGRSVAIPLRRLHKATEIIAGGNLDYKVDIKTHDELGQLSRAFNEMTVELGESYVKLEKEIAERQNAQEELKSANRALRTLSECNQVLVRATEESALLNDICRIIVKVGGYRMVWVGFAENDETRTVHPVAKAGYDEGYLETLGVVTWADTERSKGPVATAIRTGVPCIIRDIQTDPGFDLWRDEALKRGYYSILSLPLIIDGQTLGALAIFASERNAFDSEEVGLLSEMANDLSYGIKSLRTSGQHMQAVEALKKSESRLHLQFDRMPVGCILWNPEFRVLSWNPAAEKIFGFTAEEAQGKHPYGFIVPKEAQPHVDIIWQRLLEGDTTAQSVNENITKDGHAIICDWTNTPIKEADGTVIGVLSMVQDITERKRSEEKMAELYHQIKEEAEVSKSLLSVIETITASLEEREIIRNLTDAASKYLKFDRVAIILQDAAAGGFTLTSGFGLTPAEEGIVRSKVFRKGDFPAIDMALNGETLIIENAHESRLLPREMVTLLHIGSTVIVPVSFRQKVIGAIYADYRDIKNLDQKSVRLLKGLADGTAAALQNSRLYRESVERLMELSSKIETIKTMAMLDREILSTIDRMTILKTAVTLVSRIIPCDRAAVLFREGEKYKVISEWGVGTFFDNVYGIESSHFALLETNRSALFIPDLASDGTACVYHREQSEIGIKASLVVPLITKGEMIGLLDIGSIFSGRLAPVHLSTAENIGSQITVALENARLYDELQQLLINTITSLASAIDAKSPWTKGHSERVTQYALQIGKEMGLKEQELERLKLAGLLHDIGKIGTYDVLLDKPDKLTLEEFELVKKHAAKGAEILGPIKQLGDIIPAIRHHHETYDGRGYPNGLEGDEIPFHARVLCVADSFDSMTADRPYRPSPGKEYAISEFNRCSGTQFDPKVVEAFLNVLKKSERELGGGAGNRTPDTADMSRML